MLSLYEATHLRVHGEDILEEALAFTTTHLQSVAATSASSLSKQISHALRQSLHKNLPRLEANRYIRSCQEDPLHNEVLLRFAKLDFNILQREHRKELCDIARWWKDLDVPRKLPFARDRITECYFWILGVYFEPEYFLGRKILTKAIAMASILDDIYDVHGTIKELELLTEAIGTWDISAIKHLPEYMKVFYEALLDVYNDIEKYMIDEGKLYRMHYAKEVVKFEQKRGHVASSVECYMKQHDTTRQKAVDEFYRQISEAWKDVNEECLHPTSVPMPLLMRIINLARVIDVAYKDGDGYTFSGILLKDFVASLLVDPMPL
ncbi:Terpene synthase 21, putative isoform 3 [Theobroma cacao]|uniref:Terpene synthase 21, putative isoform 3 n=1 Tax=Theobroma cacao TaxID=3641 RepID=A0A061FEC7_THECC|nr:Terpene synthase 21, putative isoform 3 [Theobroma cacao]